MLMNHGTCTLRQADQQPALCTPVRDCREAQALLAAPLPEGYVLQPQPLPVGADRHAGADCEVVHLPSGTTARFRGYAAGA
jgi:hypothetical protein